MGAEFAVPFASNMSCLHKDSFKFNEILNFSPYLEEDFLAMSKKHANMQLRVILPGESLNIKDGSMVENNIEFRDSIKTNSIFDLLKKYQEKKSSTLCDHYAKEKQSRANFRVISKYFKKVFESTPVLFSWILGESVWISTNDGDKCWININFKTKNLILRYAKPLEKNAIIFAIPPYVLNDLCGKSHWNSVGVSKLLSIEIQKGEKRHELFNLLCIAQESGGALPVSNIINPRFFMTWLRRWREVLDLIHLFVKISKDFSGKMLLN